MIKKTAITILLQILSIQLFAQKYTEPSLTRILFILDGSQSMLSKWEDGNKMEVARELLTNMADSLSRIDNVELALRVYGHQKPVPPQDCNDTKLEVPFSKRNIKKIKNKLRAIRPKGTTPIAHSLELSIHDFPKCDNCRNIIILITDGIESCDGDPCAVSLQLQKKGIILKPFVIGIGLDEEFKETFNCVGRYYNATNKKRFKEILDVVISQALNSTTMQVNLLDTYNNPTETDVNMTFYNSVSGEMLYNFIHTLNYKGNPDTLSIDPVPVYNIVIHTIPSITINNISLNPGEHNTVSVKAPQGKLSIKTNSSDVYKDLDIIVKQKDSCNILNIQKVNTEEKYITGSYNIEVLTLPRLTFNNIKIEQSKTSVIQIPEPGLITFIGGANAYGAVYKIENNNIIWVCNLKSNTRIQTIPLLPGDYRVISRPINAKESIFTSNIKFKVISRSADKITLF
jgi:Ca-activated chloride channel family protein